MNDIDGIDLNNLKHEHEFKTVFMAKYGNDDKTVMKLKEIITEIKNSHYEYNLTELYKDICRTIWKFSAPELGEIGYLLSKHKIILSREESLNQPKKIHMINGLWKCKFCKGKGGHLREINKIGALYEYFFRCKECDGEGISTNKESNYWDPFMTREQMGKDPALNELFRMIKL